MIASAVVCPDPLESARLAATLAANPEAVRPGKDHTATGIKDQARRGGVGAHRAMPAGFVMAGCGSAKTCSSTSVKRSGEPVVEFFSCAPRWLVSFALGPSLLVCLCRLRAVTLPR
jgi:hypothetical protein